MKKCRLLANRLGRRALFLSGLLALVLAASCRAEDSSLTDVSTPTESGGVFFTPKEMLILGTQHYVYNDTALNVELPEGFVLNGDFNAWRSDISTQTTPTAALKAMKNWKLFSLGARVSVTGRANDSASNAFDLIGSAHTDSKDFMTSLGLDLNVTHNYAYIPVSAVKTDALGVTNKTPTVSLSQQFYDTRATFDYGHTSYNKDVAAIAAIINRDTAIYHFIDFSGVTGVIQGFPDYTYTAGLYQDLDALPITLWTTYQKIAFVNTVLQPHATSDSYTIGTDYYFLENWTATLQYNYLRETGQPAGDYYGASVSVRF